MKKPQKNIPYKTNVRRWYEDNSNGINNSHKQAKAILPSGEKIFVDAKMKPLLQKLWSKGYITSYSCQGGHAHTWGLYQHLGSRSDNHDSNGDLLFTTERGQLAFYLTFKNKFPAKVSQIDLFTVSYPGFRFPKVLLPYLISTASSLPQIDNEEVTTMISEYIASSEYIIPEFPQFPAYNEFRELRNKIYASHVDPPLEENPEDSKHEKIYKKKPSGLVPMHVFMDY